MVLMAESLYDLKIPRKLLSDVYIDLSDRCDSLEDFSVEVAISRPQGLLHAGNFRGFKAEVK